MVFKRRVLCAGVTVCVGRLDCSGDEIILIAPAITIHKTKIEKGLDRSMVTSACAAE